MGLDDFGSNLHYLHWKVKDWKQACLEVDCCFSLKIGFLQLLGLKSLDLWWGLVHHRFPQTVFLVLPEGKIVCMKIQKL